MDRWIRSTSFGHSDYSVMIGTQDMDNSEHSLQQTRQTLA
jgi:hypothetical protein